MPIDPDATPTYKPGDIVRLKSGGVPMVVTHQDPNYLPLDKPSLDFYSPEAYVCVWHDNAGSPRTGSYRVDVLVAAG